MSVPYRRPRWLITVEYWLFYQRAFNPHAPSLSIERENLFASMLVGGAGDGIRSTLYGALGDTLGSISFETKSLSSKISDKRFLNLRVSHVSKIPAQTRKSRRRVIL